GQLAETSDSGESKLEERAAPAACLPEAIVVVAGLYKGNLGSAKVGAKQNSASSSGSISDSKKVRRHEEAAMEKDAMLGEEVLTDTVSEDAVAASERQNSTGGKGVSTPSPAGLRKAIESAPKDATKTEQQRSSERKLTKSAGKAAS
ncbi:hypothetical protein TeGR_g4149, partial [Tetraparma gracilis]